MFPALALRILRTTDPRLLGKFAWSFGMNRLLSVEKFKRWNLAGLEKRRQALPPP